MNIEISPQSKLEYSIRAIERAFFIVPPESQDWYNYHETLSELYKEFMNLEHDKTKNQIRQSKINSNKEERQV